MSHPGQGGMLPPRPEASRTTTQPSTSASIDPHTATTGARPGQKHGQALVKAGGGSPSPLVASIMGMVVLQHGEALSTGKS